MTRPLAALLAAAALAGCTSGGPTAAPTTAPPTTGPGSPTATSVPSASPSVSLDAATAAVRALYDRAVDGGTAKVEFSMGTGNGRLDGAGTVDLVNGTAALSAVPSGRVSGAVSRLTFRTDESRIWVRVPEDDRAANGGKEWASAPLTTADFGLTPSSALPPVLRMFTVADQVEDLGVGKAYDVTARQYHVRLPLEAAAATMDDARAAALRQVAEVLPEPFLYYNVWLDTAGRPVRLRTLIEGIGGAKPVAMSVDLMDYGTGEPVVLPGPDETREVASLDAAFDAAGA